jgi:hypothetical protein
MPWRNCCSALSWFSLFISSVLLLTKRDGSFIRFSVFGKNFLYITIGWAFHGEISIKPMDWEILKVWVEGQPFKARGTLEMYRCREISPFSYLLL